MVGEVITVDGFRAAITSVEGSNGNFSGSCDLFVPFVGAKIQCTFKNITVTQSMQVSNGSIIAVRGPKVTFVGGGNCGGTGDDNGNGTGNGAGGAGNYQISGDTSLVRACNGWRELYYQYCRAFYWFIVACAKGSIKGCC